LKERSILGILLVLSFLAAFGQVSDAATGKQPMTVNGDIVEFKTEGKEIVAQGNVEILSQESRMTCDKVRVFMDEKIAIAEGNVKFRKESGEEMRGDMMIYDFGSQTGTVIHPTIKMAPYYGKCDLMEKLSDEEFILYDAEVATCDLPHPHYKLSCREVKMNPGRLLTAKDVRLSILDVPLMYLPGYSQRLTDKRPRFMITPGYKKNYGAELFASWRYYLNPNAQGLLHFDWYQLKGWAQGIDLNYDTKSVGTGNFKYYRIGEKDTRREVLESERRNNERSRVELRHRWDSTANDHVVLEYFRQSDPNFRKEYFFREYERQPTPASFFLWSHVFPNATLSFLGQPRVNQFETVLQKIPELKLETTNQKILGSPFYYKNLSTLTQLSGTTAFVSTTTDVSRMDTTNQISYPFQFFGLYFNPYVGERNTYYSRGLDANKNYNRNMFLGGMDMSMKLFKTYDVQTKALGLNIDKVRHVITPTVQYRYQHEPSVYKSLLQQLDEVDSLDRTNMLTFGLENKLQTKRDGNSVDLGVLLLSSDYNLQTHDGQDKGFQNLRYRLELNPYSRWGFVSEGEYSVDLVAFKKIDASLWTHLSKNASLNLGYNFKKSESSQITAGFSCVLNPFWKVNIYERFEFKTGDLIEQEYILERDMHCWIMEFIINQRQDHGITFMIAFKLKAFPDIGINAEKTFVPSEASRS
jgi:lipopolysaccharide assembly outer membrane protein LptD (OstA)